MNTYISDELSLQKAVSEAVQKGIEEKLPEILYKANRKKIYTIDEVCSELSVSRRQLQYLRDTNQIGFIRNGRKVYFRVEDLDKYFSENHIPPVNNSDDD